MVSTPLKEAGTVWPRKCRTLRGRLARRSIRAEKEISLIRLLPWLIGVIVIAVAAGAWYESREQGGFGRFVDRVRYGDEGPLERAGRKIDDAIEETVKDLRDD